MNSWVENLNPGTLVFRADASAEIGTGHVMRCLALAQAWRDAGGRAIFALRHSTDSIRQKLESEGFACRVLSPSPQEDAVLTTTAAAEQGANWVVLDGYAFSNEYKMTLRAAGLKLLCIDDNGENYAFADIILNSNLHAQRATYRDIAPDVRLLLGPKFALLRRDFREWKGQKQFSHSCRRVLVAMGGSDPHNLTELALRSLRLANVPDLEIRVAAGQSNPQLSRLRAYCKAHDIELHGDASMPELIAWADFAVAAAGSTCLEFCFFGLPAIVIDAAANQLAVARELHRRGLAIHIPLSQANENKIANEIQLLAEKPEFREPMSRASEGLVDGRGAERVVNAIVAGSLSLRPAAASDARLFWKWANEPVVRQASFNSAAVGWEEHKHWFQRRRADEGSQLFIFEDTAGRVVATVRFEAENAATSKISVTIGPEHRGLGLAPQIIKNAVSEVLRRTRLQKIEALIKPENTASLRAFRAAGFSFAGTTEVNGCEAAVYLIRRSEVKGTIAEAAEEVRCG